MATLSAISDAGAAASAAARASDVHHTAADTLDKIDPHDLARGAAAIASLTWTLGLNGV